VPNYRRLSAPGGTYFFTVNLANRSERLLTENIALLRRAFADARRHSPFTIEAIVILPDHLHCVWVMPAGDRDFSSRWHFIKARFSHGISHSGSVSVSRAARHERGVWQRRFWEHVIRDEDDYVAHLDYIHYNPVKHGHARSAAEWPFSSFHRYVRVGAYPADWANGEERKGSFGEAA